MHSVEIYLKSHLPDARGTGLVRDIHDLGITTVSDVRVVDIYWLDAELKADELDLVCCSLLADPVTQEYRWSTPGADTGKRHPPAGTKPKDNDRFHAIEVAHNPGVTDPAEDFNRSVLKAGLNNMANVKSCNFKVKIHVLKSHLSGFYF